MARTLRRRLLTPGTATLLGNGKGEVTKQGGVFKVQLTFCRAFPRGVYKDASGKNWDMSFAKRLNPEAVENYMEFQD